MLNVPKIKGRMREMKWTQESLAKEMGINPTTINYKINRKKKGGGMDKKHKIKILQINGKANQIFIDDLELRGVCGYEIQNSENVSDDINNKMILVIEFVTTQLLEISGN